jgi:HPt (histidine-containing phosphotransfer) domain-containing protein
MNDFVAKPVDPDALFATMLKWLPSQDVGLARLTKLPTSDNEALVARLSLLPGIDSAQGLATLRGQADKYLHLLHVFAESHHADIEQIQRLITAKQFNEAKQLAHNLKGVAATLGIRHLAKQAGLLEVALQQTHWGRDSDALVKMIADELAEVVAAILGLPQEPVEATAEPSDLSRQIEILDELEYLLTLSDTRVEQLLLDHASLLSYIFGVHYDSFKQYIESFDYESALASLRSLRESLNPVKN